MAKKGSVSKFAEALPEERPIRYKLYKYLFLIVCEDQKTEPYYFDYFKSQFPSDSIFLRAVGAGKDPKRVVEEAIEERKKLALEAKRDVDEVWVTFDKDDADENVKKIKNFEEAFEVALQENIEVAYSNEVFEIWLLLHFTNINKDIPLPRNQVYDMLQVQIRKTKKYAEYVYDHKKPNPKTIEIVFEIGSLESAIKRAEILMEKQKGRKPIEANPSTKVYILMQQLQAWIKYFSYIS